MSGCKLLHRTGSPVLWPLLTCVLDPVRFLDLIKPFAPILPEVASPETKIPFNQKLMWTGVRTNALFRAILDYGRQLRLTTIIVDAHDIFGHESNALIRNRIIGHVGPVVLAALDDG
jgi:hypothetical protein